MQKIDQIGKQDVSYFFKESALMQVSKDAEYLLSPNLGAQALLSRVKQVDTRALVKSLWHDVRHEIFSLNGAARGARVLARVHLHSQTLNLYSNEYGSISVSRLHPETDDELVYAPFGKTVLFATGDDSPSIAKFDIDDNVLVNERRLTIACGVPVSVDHDHEAYCHTWGPEDRVGLVGGVHLSGDPSDIKVFDRRSGENVAWFPGDERVTKCLVALEALASINDPGAQEICRELIYHYHPAVCFEAFRQLYRLAPKDAESFIPLLKSRGDEKLFAAVRDCIGAGDGS
ncbi:HEAT repeat domain-containing protein [Pandoraea sp. NPDC087047]|uniref:HEAT repeat domain-containing protein n=1 Tax=Pandoraea sp. NPDC087047 TaxID=3364390 RepID=UPI00380A2A33